MAQRTQGLTNEVLLQLLERCLDNVIYRLGWARTRRQARQFVRHGHILVDGQRVNIPSYLVKSQQTITVKHASHSSPYIREMLEILANTPKWLSGKMVEGQVLHIPVLEDIHTDINA